MQTRKENRSVKEEKTDAKQIKTQQKPATTST